MRRTSGLLVAALVHALLFTECVKAAEPDDWFRFVEPPPRSGPLSAEPETKIIVPKNWTEPERQRIIGLLRKTQQEAPGLVERASYLGRIGLLRSAYATGEGPLATANRDTNEIVFTDRFFRESAGIGTVVHELAHLADIALVNETSPEWDRLVRARCQRIRQRISDDGIQLSYGSDWNHLEKTYRGYAREQGVPSVYACVNWAESLAEHVSAILHGYRPPKAAASYIDVNYLRSPYEPTAAIAAFREARSLFLAGQNKQAISAYSNLLSSHPDLSVLYLHRGRARSKANHLAAALADYDKAVDIFVGNERLDKAASIHYRRAILYSLMRKPDSAVAALDRALELRPGWIEYHFKRGQLLLDGLEEPRRAISDFDEILRLRPESVPVYLARAQAWRVLEEYERMEDDFATAISIQPDYGESYYRRGAARKERGLCRLAIPDFGQTIDLQTQHVLDYAYVKRAECRETLDDFPGAIADYTAVLESAKRWAPYPIPHYHAARALVYFKAGQHKDAWQDLQVVLLLPQLAVATGSEMIAWNEEDPLGYLYRGQAYFKGEKKDHDLALADLNRAIALQPRLKLAHLLRGYIYATKEDYDRALADFGTVIELDPKHWMAYANRSRIYQWQGNSEAAIEDLKEAVRLNPKDEKLAARLRALSAETEAR